MVPKLFEPLRFDLTKILVHLHSLSAGLHSAVVDVPDCRCKILKFESQLGHITFLEIDHEIITKTRLFKYIENFTTTKGKFSEKKSDIFHISSQTIDCGYSLEPPRRGGSNEYPQSMFINKIRKIMYTPVNPSFTIYKWGLRGSKLYRRVFVMHCYGHSPLPLIQEGQLSVTAESTMYVHEYCLTAKRAESVQEKCK